ncbi:S66 family peptidase [Glutamicibacter nicotianae]|uniref:S66 family peptidase n=1 Tax=Glutamicibacter nicotianae TaxID=37929 RepID=UPI00195C3AC1|nr:S66 peptidase family protein [Glutamicibacter nicotianae]MBM7767886.1 muramoyltetrapeptide carboxypeptidase LdcA involved in peptidoglycan recycling [Glutamicibacter nicotianae]
MPSPLKPTVIPARLQAGDAVRVIAPSCSRTFVMEFDNTQWINERFDAMGLKLEFGEHVDENDDFDSSSIPSRVADLHAAFADASVAGIISVIGGFNSNELLPYLDWELIAANPKVFCGYSDFTALANAVHAKTGLVTYIGAHWSSFGMRDHFEPTGQWFRAATHEHAWSIEHATEFTDDLWFMDQDNRSVNATSGPWILNEGAATGMVIGGNLGTLRLLQGTEFMPSLDGAVLFVEDDGAADIHEFARSLASLLQIPEAEKIRGLAIGRFQLESSITRSLLEQVIAKHPILQDLPVVANLDFGHTSPMFTIPIGGYATLSTSDDAVQLRFAHARNQLS